MDKNLLLGYLSLVPGFFTGCMYFLVVQMKFLIYCFEVY